MKFISMIGLLFLIACSFEHEVQKDNKEIIMSDVHEEITEAQDVVNVIKKFYRIGQKVSNADVGKFATCHDKTIGYDKLLKCVSEIRQEISEELIKFPSSIAHSSNGKDIETIELAYVKGRLSFFTDYESWMISNKVHLASLMINRSMDDVNQIDNLGKWMDDKPYGTDDKYAPQYMKIMGIQCTKDLFECTPPASGNVCWINKVADRLGASDPPKAPWGELKDKQTGKQIK